MSPDVRRGLGRGLSALLGEDAPPPAAAGVRTVPVEHLHPGRFQPRRRFDEDALEALAQSIAAQGVLQPLVVRPHRDRPGEYEILAGERRWRAAQRAKLHEVPVVLRDVADRDALEFALVENVQREDLNALEEADGYQRLIAEFNYTQDALAQRVGKSRSHVANTLRLLALPDEAKAMVADGRLTAGHARALLTARDPLALAREAVRHGMSVRQVENAARPSEGRSAATAAPMRDANVAALEQELQMRLGMKVAIRHPAGVAGGGELAIRYRTLDQLQDLIERLKNPLRQ
jgi:ParB family transcriptional regulator, chromosome partitioning protein